MGKSFLLKLILTFGSSTLIGQVSGTIFRDYNGNGQKDNSSIYNEPFVSGAIIKAYDASGTEVGYTTSDNNGAYAFTGLSLPLRVEFSGNPAGQYPSAAGSNSHSSVQFYTVSTNNAHFGVNYPEEAWENTSQSTPQVMFPCYVSGYNTAANRSEATIVSLSHSANGPTATRHYVATHEETGTVWGNAYQRAKDRFFYASMLKRHSGIGPKGVGGVYIVQKVGGVYDLAASFTLHGVTPSNSVVALDLGSVTRNTTVGNDNYLNNHATNKSEPSRDMDAFAKIGKVGFGDIDLDEAAQKLYMVNLNQRQIVVLDVSNETSALDNAPASTLGPLTSVYNIMTLPGLPNCVNGELRPWALKVHRGKGYLGVVCSGRDGVNPRNIANVRGYILSFDPQNINAGFTTVLSLNLNYPLAGRWSPWADTWAETGLALSYSLGSTMMYRQPVLSDIEFDETNGMTIAIMDRFGHQTGYENYLPVSGNTSTDSGGGYGDQLYACYNSSTGTWTMEGGAGCPAINPTTLHYGTWQANEGYSGTGTHEYFDDTSGDDFPDNGMGAVAQIKGTGKMVAITVDPHPDGQVGAPYWNTGGPQWYQIATGKNVQWVQIYNENGFTYGKASGLGDLEPALAPASIEIGNRVWIDSNPNGIQDADESGIGNVSVDLCSDFDNDGNCDLITDPPVSGCSNNTAATGAAINCSGNVAWSNPTSANTVNGTGATAALTSTNTTTHCLQLTGMGFSIPSNATITGVSIAITRNASIASAAVDESVRLLIAGSALGDDKADGFTAYPTTFMAATYGNAWDTWNLNLTPANINAANFGVSIRSRWQAGSPTVRIDGVVVSVCYTTPGASTTIMATTTTQALAGNSLGTWYFNKSNVIDGDPTLPGNQRGLAPGKKYLISIGSADWTSGLGVGDLSGMLLTSSNIGGSGQPDVRDNDALLLATIPTIAYTTGNFGENDHTLDFGFRSCVNPSSTVSLSAPTCSGSTADNNGKITLTAITNADKFGTSIGATYSGAAYASATAIGTLPQDLQTAIPNTGGTYTIRFFNGADDCFRDTTVTVAPVCCMLAGTDGATSICDNSFAPIDLAELLIGEQPSGVWERATGTGGIFEAMSGTFLPAPGATTSTFIYVVTGIAPCVPDTSVATVTITSAPSGEVIDQTAPTCTGIMSDNNGSATLTSVLNAARFGICSLNALNYDGPAFAAAGAISLPQSLITSVPNTGGDYIVRLFKTSTCYTDFTLSFAPVVCTCPVPNCSTAIIQKN